MGLLDSYGMRLRRRRLRLRARLKARELRRVEDRTALIRPGDVIALSTFRNERARLPYFLRHYREMGVAHFLMVDNASDDGGRELLAAQPDVSLWTTEASYRASRFGADWLNHLASRHGHGHWCLTVDPDELLVYPYCDTRPIRALCDWLDGVGARSFGAMLLDLYPKGPIEGAICAEGQDPREVAAWFDGGNYTYERNPRFRNLWIRGGPRARAFFADAPAKAPALNKIPLVRWRRGYAYASSTHALLPRGLNLTYDRWGGEKAAGVLLHTKLIGGFAAKAEEEGRRRQHYAGGREYRGYAAAGSPDLWNRWSEKYINWRQLEVLGLISKGDWA